MAQDRVIKGTSDGRLYRVIAGEAHSWNFLLIEDQLGERFRIDTRSRSLIPISDEDVRELMDARTFRPWAGSRLWGSLNELPLAQMPTSRSEPLGHPIEQSQTSDALADA